MLFRKTRRSCSCLFVVIAATLTTDQYLASGQHASSASLWAQSPAASTSTPEEQPPFTFQELRFRLTPSRYWHVRSPLLGQVTNIGVNEGELISQGTLLIQLNDRRAQLEYAIAEAKYRSSFLKYRQAVARKDDNEVAFTNAEKIASGQMLRVAKIRVDQHAIRAPIDGYTYELLANRGAILQAGDTAVTLADEQTLHVEIPISRERVTIGGKVAILIENQLLDATVLSIAEPTSDQRRLQAIDPNMATVKVSVPNANQKFRRGDAVLPLQFPYSLIPRQAISIDAVGQATITVQRNEKPVAIPVDVLASVEGNRFFAAAPYQNGDLILQPAAMGEKVSPTPIAGTVIFPVQAATASDVAALAQALPQFTSTLELLTPQASEEVSEKTNIEIHVPMPVELRGILQNADYPISELDLTRLFKTLELSPDQKIAFEQLQKEFNAKIEEQGLKIESLDRLKEMSGEEYKTFLQAIRGINHDFADQLAAELDDDQAEELEQAFADYFGVAELAEPGKLATKLSLSTEQQQEIAAAINSIDESRFQTIQELVKGAVTGDAARGQIMKITEEHVTGLEFLPPDVSDRILSTEMRASKTNAGTVANSTMTANEANQNQPAETAEERAAREDRERAQSKARMLAKIRGDAESSGQQSSGEEIDYGFYALIGGIGIVIVGALLYFTGFFSKTATSGKATKSKSKKKASGKTRTIQVGEDETITTIAEAIQDARDNAEVKEGVPWDRQVIELAEGTYDERIVLNSSDPVGIELRARENAVVVLTSPEKRPAIELNGVHNFEAAGIVVEANGTGNAVLARDCRGSLRFDNVTVGGFTQVGMNISGRVTEANLQVELQDCRIETTAEESMGMNFDLSTYDESRIQLESCRVVGPMHIGMVLKSPVQRLDIRTSIFANLEVGLLLAGTSHPYESAALTNNTFFSLTKGVSLKHIDELSTSGKQLSFYSNLFSQIQFAEISVSGEESVDRCDEIQKALNDMVVNNLTDREDAADNEIGQLSPLGTEEHVASEFGFVSTDVSDAQFLAPGPESPQRTSRRKFGSESYIGAVGP